MGVFPLQLRNVEESVINYTRNAAKYAVKRRNTAVLRIRHVTQLLKKGLSSMRVSIYM